MTTKKKKEEELLNANSNYQAPSNMTLDEWYGSNKKQLESNRQKQVEEAYVNQQLMNKYLGTQMANAGLSNTGAANLYYNNANANYRNEVGNINAAYQNSQQDLLNQYYGYKKEEQDKADALAREEEAKKAADLKTKQDTLLGIYTDKINSSKNEYGYLDDETINNLYTQFDKEGLGETNSAYLDTLINMNRGSEEDIRNANYDRNYKDLAYKYESEFTNNVGQYDAYLAELNEALSSGKINKEQYYTLKTYLDETVAADKSNKEQEREKYANEYYENYLSMADAEIGKYGVLTEDQYNNLIEKYKVENIGEERMEILENYLKQFVATDEEKKELDSIKTKTALQNLNSTVDVNNVIDPQYASAKSFGSFVGSGIGKKQDTYINQIIMGAKENVFNDGDIIDANYGMGKDLYMFYGGKFYKVSEGSATVTNDNISDFFAKKGKLLPR